MKDRNLRIFLLGIVFVSISLLLTLIQAPGIATAQWIADRRADQFPTEFGYLVVPLPYSMPGLGQGIFWMGHFSNAFGTTADLTAIYATGDVKGPLVNGAEIPIIPGLLQFDGFASNLSRVGINIYQKRGMNTVKDDYILVELNKVQEKNLQLTATLFDRRFNLFAGLYAGNMAVTAFRDPDGNMIQKFDDPWKLQFRSRFAGAQVDITDSFQDPRRGFRMKTIRTRYPATGPTESAYDTVDYDVQGYIPVGKINTLVLNYYISDAIVTHEGVTDPASVRTELGGILPGRRQRLRGSRGSPGCKYRRRPQEWHGQRPGRAEPPALLSPGPVRRRTHGLLWRGVSLESDGRDHPI